MKKRIVFCDYDGTIFVDETGISKNVGAIRRYRERGGIFVVATGRSRASFDKVVEQYDVPYDYLITNNGALTLDGNGDVIGQYAIAPDVVEKVRDFLLEKFPGVEIMYYDADADKIDFAEREMLKIRAQVEDEDMAWDIERGINKAFGGTVLGHAVVSSRYYSGILGAFVDIVSAGAGKEKAIRDVLLKLGLDKSEATAIGDGGNDLEMIREYGGFSLDSAEERVKTAATKVFGSVAEALDSLY